MLTKKTFYLIFVIVLAASMFLSACGNNNSAGSSSGEDSSNASTTDNDSVKEEPELEEVNLVWYYIGPEQPDYKSVEEAINKITKEKINATVTLKASDWNYQDKLNPVVASGEEFDIVWTSNWTFNYTQNVRKGAFIPLDDMIDEYMPKTRADLPQFAWDGVKVDGKIYGIPSYQIMARNPGYIVRKDLAEKYGFDPASIQKTRDIEPFLQTIKENEPELVPFSGKPIENLIFMRREWGQENVNKFASYDLDAPEIEVSNAFDSEFFRDIVDITRDWYEKGYISKDAALNNHRELLDQGRVAVTAHNTLKPGGNIDLFKRQDGTNVNGVYAPFIHPYVPGDAAQSTINAISRTSENPERALMFLELVNTDKELFNLIAYGIEGKHYKKIDDQFIEKMPDNGYNPGTNWVFGNTFNEYLIKGQSPTLHEETLKMNNEAKPDRLMGFVFNEEPVLTQIANLNSVLETFLPILLTGTEEPDSIMPEFQIKLKDAGIDEVVAEIQKQIDEWELNQ